MKIKILDTKFLNFIILQQERNLHSSLAFPALRIPLVAPFPSPDSSQLNLRVHYKLKLSFFISHAQIKSPISRAKHLPSVFVEHIFL